MLLLVRTVAMIEIDVDSGATLKTDSSSGTVVNIGSAKAGITDGKFFCEGLPTRLCQRLERRLDLDPKNFSREMRELPERFIGHWGTAMFLLVPVYAAVLGLVYVDRKRRYTEHLVFALHLHSAWFVALAITLLPWDPIKFLAIVAMPVYAWMAARRVYGGGRWATFFRAALIIMLYGVVLALALALVAAWTFIS